jgi:NADH-quinone oxidoreductase subunit L
VIPAHGPAAAQHSGAEGLLQIVASLVALAGVALAYLLALGRPALRARLEATRAGGVLERFWRAGWGWDALAERLVIRPFLGAARAGAGDVLDAALGGLGRLAASLHALLSATQTGRLRAYVLAVALGAAALLALAVLR